MALKNIIPNRTVNVPLIGTLNIVTALAGGALLLLVFTKSGIFRKTMSSKTTKITYRK